MSRSSKEPYLVIVEDFCFFIKTKGAFKGYWDVVLKGTHTGKKNDSLTISNHTHQEKQDNIIYIYIYQINPADLLDEYNIVNTYINVCMPPKHLLKGNITQHF